MFSCFKNYDCTMAVFPESVLSGDEIFSQPKASQKLEQIYKAGFFSTSFSSYRSKKTGINYFKESCEIKTVANPSASDYEEMLNKFQKISNENTLFSNYIYGKEIECKAPFPKILNNLYTLTFIIPIYHLSSSTSNFKIFISSGLICQHSFSGLKNFKITIKYNEVSQKMLFTCIEPVSSSTKEINISDNTDIKIIFSSSDSGLFYLTSYVVTIKDSSSTTVATYNGNKIGQSQSY